MMNSSATSSPRAKTPRRSNIPWARLLVAAALLIGLVWISGAKNVFLAFSRLDIVFTIACATTTIIFFLMGSLNIWWLLRCRHALSYGQFLRSYAYGFSIGLLSPGQIGDASLVLFLRRNDIPLSVSSAAYAMDKVISLSFLIVVAFFGLYQYSLLGVVQIAAIVVATSTTIVVCVVLVRKKRFDNRLFRMAYKLIDELLEYRNHVAAIFVNVFLTAIKWLVMAVTYYLAFQAFQTTIDWPAIGIIPVMASLVGYIPISIGGIGTVEVSAVMLFKLIGIGEAIVLSAYVLLRSLQYLLAFCLMLFISEKK